MSQEQMETKLIDKTIEQRNEILANAQEKANKITTTMEAEKKRIEEITNQAIQNVIGGELRAVHDRIVGGAELQGRKIVMEARFEVIAKVFDKVALELKSVVEGPDYKDVLEKLAIESITILNEDCIVYANKEDAEHLSSVMEKLAVGVKVMVETSPVDIVGGVTVVNLEGTKTITNTLDARLNASQGRLTSEVANKLGVI
jgi:vacuolar-type H+-ATPase subunit E/Vma4